MAESLTGRYLESWGFRKVGVSTRSRASTRVSTSARSPRRTCAGPPPSARRAARTSSPCAAGGFSRRPSDEWAFPQAGQGMRTGEPPTRRVGPHGPTPECAVGSLRWPARYRDLTARDTGFVNPISAGRDRAGGCQRPSVPSRFTRFPYGEGTIADTLVSTCTGSESAEDQASELCSLG